MTGRTTPLEAAVKEAKPAFTAMIGIGVFVNLALLVPPLYMLQVYDRVLSSGNIGTLIMLSAIAIVMLVIYGILEFCRNGILIRASRQFDETVSVPLFRELMLSVRRDTPSAGSQALHDVATLRDTIASGTLASLSDVPWTPFFIGLCFLMHPALGTVALFATIVIFSLALLTDKLTRNHIKQSTKQSAQAGRSAQTAFQNSGVLRGLGMTGAMQNRWLKSKNAMLDAQSLAGERAALMLAMSKFTRLAVQSAILGTGAWLAVQNEITPGIMIAASIIMGRALAPVEQVVSNWKRIIASRESYARLTAIFKLLPDSIEPTDLPKPKGHLSIENVTIVPPGAKQASLNGVSLKLSPGEVLAIVGRSGSGKSSLARAIAGVWPVANGAIRLDGASLDQWSPSILGNHMGYIAQDVVLFDGTIAQNIARLGDADDEDVVNAGKLAGVHEAILHLPNGYDTVIGEQGTTLSGGMSQRVALARAVFKKPRLIVLDEPNANLDAEGDAALAQSLEALKAAGSTIVVITHKPQLLSQVDKVLILNNGTTQAFGPRDKVLKPMRPTQISQSNNDEPVEKAGSKAA